MKLFIDGILDGSGTITPFTNIGGSVGWADAPGANKVVYVRDIYADDSTALTDPGDIRVTAKRPAPNNVNNFDTAVGANPANRWTNVNERALSETNAWEQLLLADTQENFTLEAANIGDVDLSEVGISLIARLAWIWAKATVGALGTPKIMDNGAETAIVLTTSPALYTVLTDSASYPSNAAGIGMRAANAAAATFLYECGTLIAYLAPAVVPLSWQNQVPVMKSHYTPIRAIASGSRPGRMN